MSVILPSELRVFLQRWLITTLSVLVAANVLRGIRYDTISGLLAATLLLGLLNAFVRPVMMLLSLPLLVVSLGLFTVIINALLLYFVGQFEFFHVDSFWTAIKGAVLIGFVSFLLSIATGLGGGRVRVRRSQEPPRPPGSRPGRGGGGGPVIDV
jgi:putative membrane protein